MKISLLILSWWCFSCLHIQRIGIQYTDQLFWKIIYTLGKVDIIFINKTSIYLFHFSDLQNLVKSTDSMVPCYSLLNMKIIWLYMVSAPPPITIGGRGDDLIWKFAKILWWQNFFLTFVAGQTSMGGVKSKWGSNTYYYITTLLLFHFFRNSQHPENWSVSFGNFFRKCECISCYFLISSNLQLQF